MAPTATIVVPTQARPDYLDVALGSILPQARALHVPVLVVDDGPSAATRAVTQKHGARYVAHDGPRGLNAARNTAIDHTGSDLLLFVDDDVRVHEGWLAALLDAGAALPDEVAVLTGPIVPVFEDHALRMCGREGAPITFLDLGPVDVDAEYAWGANMTIRRSALNRAGRFDASRPLYGDEAEWQDRVKAAGGRVRYVAAAGLDHRRAGDDARLPSLCRAARARGQASRRHDVFKGSVPSLRAELRVLAGCLLHTVRYRCANGIVMAAHSAGRVREALDPTPPPATPGVDDFLSGASGTVGGRRGTVLRARDMVADLRTAPARARIRRRAAERPFLVALATTKGHSQAGPPPAHPDRPSYPAQAGQDGRSGAARAPGAPEGAGPDPRPRPRLLVLGVERPGSLMPAALTELRRGATVELTVGVQPPEPGKGKFANLNEQLAAHDLSAFDWLLVLDDDVTLPRHFLDVLVHEAAAHDLRLAQPAHRLHSHAAWPVTRRQGARTRRTTFVEIGPVTLFHHDTFATLLPFPAELQMGWGLDCHWAAVARAHGWALGVVDAVPIGHTVAPAGAGYSREAALQEARAFLATRPYVRREEVRTVA